MPSIEITISKQLASDEQQQLALDAIEAGAVGLQKPKEVILSIIRDDAAIVSQNTAAAAAFVHIMSIGAIPLTNRQSTVGLLCDLLKKYGIDPARVTVKFTESGKSDWGANYHVLV